MARLDEVSTEIGSLKATTENLTQGVQHLRKDVQEGFDRVASMLHQTRAELDTKIQSHTNKINGLEKKQAFWSGGIAAITSALVLFGKYVVEKFSHGP